MTSTIDRPSTSGEGHRSLLEKQGNANQRDRKERIMRAVLTVLMVIASIPIMLIVFQVVRTGWTVISWDFFTQREVPPARVGGGYAAGFVGTGIIVLWAAAMAIPLGIFAAVYLVDYGTGPFPKIIRFFTDVMTGIPSIFVGLAVYSLIIANTGFRFGAFPAAVAISIIMLPIVVRSSEEILRTVPVELKQGSLAMGARKWQTTMRVVLPAAAPGLTTGAMLAVARGAGETAPLILTAFGNIAIVTDLFNVSINALPLQIYNGARQPFDPGIQRAWGGALCLMVLVLLLTVGARFIGNRFAKTMRN
ncbi:MAG: phosphate ABC transporter permease PstA [Acidimicrobiales bacterium]